MGTPNKNINVKRAIFYAHEGHYGKSIRSSHGIASSENPTVVREIHNHHPQHDIPNSLNNVPPSLNINAKLVKAALQFFPKASSPGSSKLHYNIYLWNNFTCSSGYTHHLWLHGCVEHPVDALNKKNMEFVRLLLLERLTGGC